MRLHEANFRAKPLTRNPSVFIIYIIEVGPYEGE